MRRVRVRRPDPARIAAPARRGRREGGVFFVMIPSSPFGLEFSAGAAAHANIVSQPVAEAMAVCKACAALPTSTQRRFPKGQKAEPKAPAPYGMLLDENEAFDDLMERCAAIERGSILHSRKTTNSLDDPGRAGNSVRERQQLVEAVGAMAHGGEHMAPVRFGETAAAGEQDMGCIQDSAKSSKLLVGA